MTQEEIRQQALGWAKYYEDKYLVIARGIVAAVIQRESNFQPLAGGAAGELGLMQIMPRYALADYNTHSGERKVEVLELVAIEPNIRVGSWYLLEWIPKLLKDAGVPVTLERALAAYNAGPSVSIAKSWPLSTENYITDVVRIAGYSRSTPLKPSRTTIFWLAGAIGGMIAAYKMT